MFGAARLQLLGHAMNNDAFHMTAPDTSGKGITAVIQAALDDAGVKPADVQHVNAHGGVVTWDVPILEAGRLPQPFVEQLGRLRHGLEGR